MVIVSTLCGARGNGTPRTILSLALQVQNSAALPSVMDFTAGMSRYMNYKSFIRWQRDQKTTD